MSVIEVFSIFANHLIELMAVVCFMALIIRFIAHRVNKVNQAFFNSVSRSIIKSLEEEEQKHQSVEDIEVWMTELLDKVEDHLPDRSLRFKIKGNQSRSKQKSQDLSSFSEGKRSIILALKQQVDALKSPYPPNFIEMADRVLNQDDAWRTVLRIIPVNSLSRGLDILPNLFVVGGIFGTFIGITGALPLIASIDIANLSEATPVLNEFVSKIAYSMNTSIAGIIFSVIMTLVTSLFPLNTIRDDVAKNFERAIEFMWYRIHGNKLSQGEHVVVKTLEKIGQDIVGAIQAQAAASQPKSSMKRRA